MKSYRPLILWLLIIGIGLAFLKNSSEKTPEVKKVEVPLAREFAVSYKQPARPVKFKPVLHSEKQPIVKNSVISVKKETPPDKKYPFSEFAVLSGYAQANLREKDNYEIIPAMFRFGFDLKPVLKCTNENTIAQFAVEPFLNTAFSPNSNIETGANFMLRFGYIFMQRIGVYVEAGSGIIYMTQHTREQSTQFNFGSQAGGGLYLYLNKERSFALNLGYRYRHVSNAGIEQPNKGINANMVIAGFSWFFN